MTLAKYIINAPFLPAIEGSRKNRIHRSAKLIFDIELIKIACQHEIYPNKIDFHFIETHTCALLWKMQERFDEIDYYSIEDIAKSLFLLVIKFHIEENESLIIFDKYFTQDYLQIEDYLDIEADLFSCLDFSMYLPSKGGDFLGKLQYYSDQLRINPRYMESLDPFLGVFAILKRKPIEDIEQITIYFNALVRSKKNLRNYLNVADADTISEEKYYGYTEYAKKVLGKPNSKLTEHDLLHIKLAIQYIIAKGDIEVLKELLSLSKRIVMSCKHSHGNSILHYASYYFNPSVFAEVVKNINAKQLKDICFNKKGDSLIYAVAHNGSREAFSFLASQLPLYCCFSRNSSGKSAIDVLGSKAKMPYQVIVDQDQKSVSAIQNPQPENSALVFSTRTESTLKQAASQNDSVEVSSPLKKKPRIKR